MSLLPPFLYRLIVVAYLAATVVTATGITILVSVLGATAIVGILRRLVLTTVFLDIAAMTLSGPRADYFTTLIAILLS